MASISAAEILTIALSALKCNMDILRRADDYPSLSPYTISTPLIRLVHRSLIYSRDGSLSVFGAIYAPRSSVFQTSP